MSPLALIDSIKKETKIDEKGQATVSIRGAARIVGVKEATLRTQFKGAILEPSKLAEKLASAGFEGAILETFPKNGVPDTALSLIIQYYAMDAGRNCTEQAKVILSAFIAIGLRTWLQNQTGWHQEPTSTQPEVQSSKTKALPLPEMSMRSRIIEAVDNYVFLFGLKHPQVWIAIYRKLKHTYHYDVAAKLKASGIKGRSKLEQIEADNKLEELRAVAQLVLKTEI